MRSCRLATIFHHDAAYYWAKSRIVDLRPSAFNVFACGKRLRCHAKEIAPSKEAARRRFALIQPGQAIFKAILSK